MNLGQAYPTTNKSNVGNSLQLAPTPPGRIVSATEIAHAWSGSDCLNLAYFSNYFKFDDANSQLSRSPQRLLQLRRRICLFIAILNDYRSVKRQSPFAAFFRLNSPRTGHNHSACGDFDRLLPAASINLFAHEIEYRRGSRDDCSRRQHRPLAHNGAFINAAVAPDDYVVFDDYWHCSRRL